MSPEFQAVMRYKSALGWWHAQMFAAARRGEPFAKPEPKPSDFQLGRRW